MHVLGQQHPCVDDEWILPPHMPNDLPQNPAAFGMDQQRLPATGDDREKITAARRPSASIICHVSEYYGMWWVVPTLPS
jgi:hypothetical protein